MQKHILVIQDLSCVGRCSLTAALPLFAALGIRATPLPTALFSSHTGFPAPFRRDLGEDMAGALQQWALLDLRFDAIHVGYLAESSQLHLVEEAIARYRGPDTLLFVDPVMGDWGKRYSFVDDGLLDGFRRLCRKADLIFPNRTEAALLLDEAYQRGADSPQALLHSLQGLLHLGAKAAAITGISGGDGYIGAASLRVGDSAPQVALSPAVKGAWPGTGDLFAAATQGAMLLGFSLEESLKAATGFVHQCLKDADPSPTISRFGAPFELALPWLQKTLSIT